MIKAFIRQKLEEFLDYIEDIKDAKRLSGYIKERKAMAKQKEMKTRRKKLFGKG